MLLSYNYDLYTLLPVMTLSPAYKGISLIDVNLVKIAATPLQLNISG